MRTAEQDPAAREGFESCTLLRIGENCGQRVVKFNGPSGGFAYVFDADSGELIGGMIRNDVGYAGCSVADNYYGVVEAQCSAYAECSPCPTDDLPTCE